MVPSMNDQLGDFPLAALLRTAEEHVRQAAERLEQRGALDPETSAQLADVRIWLLSAARRVPG
jgi:hypothetical protein